MKLKISILFIALMFVCSGGAFSYAGSILSLDFTSNGSGDAEYYWGAVAGTGNFLADGFTAFVVEELGPSNNVSTDPAITVGDITFAITGNVSAWPGDNIDIVAGTIDPLRGDYLFLPEVDGSLGADNTLTWTVSGLAAGAPYYFTFIHGDNGTRTVTFNTQGYELLIDGDLNWTGTLTLIADVSGIITGTATGGTGEGNWAALIVEVDTQAHDPSPADGAINVDIDSVLSWKTGLDLTNPNQINPAITKHFVWMSSGSYGDPNLFLVDTITTVADTGTYNPGGLSRDSKFWWRIDEGIGDYPAGDPNNIIGNVWSFETMPSTPAIDMHPQDALVFAGEDAVFTVDAFNPFTLSSDDLAYQWYKAPDIMLADGADYSGTTTDTLTIFSAELSDEGQYFCRLTNTAGNTLTRDTDPANLVIKRLIGHWPFDGDLTDIEGGNDAVKLGTGQVRYDDGIVGTEAVEFRVDSNPLNVPTDAHVGRAWTLAWWDNSNPTSDGGDWETMIGCGEGPTGWEIFEFGRQNGTWYAFGFNIGGDYIWSDEYPRGEWNHHVVSYDPLTLVADWYINGVKIREFTGVNFTAFEPVLYMGNVVEMSQPYVGLIDDLLLFNYTLNATDVAVIYHDIVGPYCAVRPALDFDGDCEVTINDMVIFAADWLQCGRYPQCTDVIP